MCCGRKCLLIIVLFLIYGDFLEARNDLNNQGKPNENVTSSKNNHHQRANNLYSHPILKYFYETNLTLSERLELEKSTWHWYPWKRINYFVTKDGDIKEEECEMHSSIDDFPDDIFTQRQRQQGAVLLHLLGALYFFTLLAVVCNDYFLPSVQCICEDLDISTDVAGATFMATATSTPELFVNTISVFITDSDMGLGTIIGSLLFNTLGVAAVAGLAAYKAVQLDWYPLARDCILFSFNISLLVVFAWDGQVIWYESMILVILYVVYFIVLFQNKRIMKFVKYYVEGKWNCCKKNSYDIDNTEAPPVETKVIDNKMGFINPVFVEQTRDTRNNDEKKKPPQADEKIRKSLWRIPRDSRLKTFWWLYTWPIKFILTFTIPSPKTFRKLYPLSFFLCVIWIGLNSYMIFWMVAIIGYTFTIPESVMGLTLLAWGGCLPEAITSVIVIRKGEGGLGVSNSLGANSLAILLSLGLPWFIRSMVDGGIYTGAYINIYSYGIEFTIMSLLLATAALFIILSLGHYQLKKSVGVTLISIYLIFITFAILVEMDVFFPSGNNC